MAQQDGNYEYRDTTPASFRTKVKRKTRRPGDGGAGMFLFFLGLTVTGLGVALPYAPQFSWHLVKVSRYLSGIGIENGLLVVAGTILFCMGFVARGTVRAARAGATNRPDSSESDVLLVLDQVAADLSQVLSTVGPMSQQLGSVAGAQQSLLQTQRSQAQADATGPKEHDAVFRLAASLDQLHARLEDRFQEMAGRVDARFEGVTSSVMEARGAMEAQLHAATAAAQEATRVAQAARSVPTPAAVAPTAAAPATPAPGNPAPTTTTPPRGDSAPGAPARDVAPVAKPQSAAPQTPPTRSATPEVEPELALDPEALEEASIEALEAMEEGAAPGLSRAAEGTKAFLEPEEPEAALPQADHGPEALDALLPDEAVRQSLDQERHLDG